MFRQRLDRAAEQRVRPLQMAQQRGNVDVIADFRRLDNQILPVGR